jgi:hypothetical protein
MNDKSRFFYRVSTSLLDFPPWCHSCFSFFIAGHHFLLRYLICHYEKQERQHKYSLVTDEERKINGNILLWLTKRETGREKNHLSFWNGGRSLVGFFFVLSSVTLLIKNQTLEMFICNISFLISLVYNNCIVSEINTIVQKWHMRKNLFIKINTNNKYRSWNVYKGIKLDLANHKHL